MGALIGFYGFSKEDQGALLWYCYKSQSGYVFIDDLNVLMERDIDCLLMKEDCVTEKKGCIKELTCEWDTLSAEEVEKLYEEMFSERDKALQKVADMITPGLFFEYHLITLQADGYYIRSVKENLDKSEKYIEADHRYSGKKLYIVVSLDGHTISEAEIELLATEKMERRISEYSEYARKNIVETLHLFEQIYENYRLPQALEIVKAEADQVLMPFDQYYMD